MREGIPRATPGIGLFALFVFVLTAAPRMNVQIGPIPLYLMDLLIVALIFQAMKVRRFPGRRPFAGIIVSLLAFAILGEIAGSLTSGMLMEAVYTIGRTCLAFSVFFIAGQLVRGPKDLELVLKAAVCGLTVTAALMVLTSLPATRAAVTELVFSKTFLEPAAAKYEEVYGAPGESGVRGRTLVGVSIMGATFVNGMWPFCALLLRWPGSVGYWRNLALLACLLAPMGVLMSYSRGPILGTILMLLCVLLLGVRRIRRGILLPVVVGSAIVLSVGVGSQVFFFDRLTNRTAAMFSDPLADERESERILAYSEPFEHVVSHPRFFAVGEGTTIKRSNAPSEQAGQATHAVFAQAYYANGMISALLYMVLLAWALAFALRQFRRRSGTIGAHFSQAVLLAVVALLPWFAFGHAIVSTPRGAMFFFLILGLLTSLKHFPLGSAQVTRRERGHGHGRLAAV